MRDSLRGIGSFLFVAAAGCLWPNYAVPDVVKLKGGGEVRGEVTRPPAADSQRGDSGEDADEGPIRIKTLSGATVVLDRSQIEFLSRRPLILEKYERRAKQTPDTVDAQWALAEWCRKHNLDSEREEHLKRIIELDPDHEKAHYGLGHTKHEGEWTTRDAIMKAEGYVKYKGRYVTPQELELIKKTDAQREAEQEWYPKVRIWLTWLTGRDRDRSDRGLAKLRGIDDPHALPALANFLSDHDLRAVRKLYVTILGRLPGTEAVKALVKQSLFDAHYEVRRLALNELSTEQQQVAMPLYIQALGNNRNAVVGRAAKALEQIGDERAIPHLIDALVTTHRYRVKLPSSNQFNVGFNKDGSFANPGQGLLPPNIEAALRTGQLPNGVIVLSPRVPQLPQKAKVVTIQREQKNSEVLSALKTLTEQSFGYDERTWRLWWASEKNQVQPAPFSP